MLGLVLADDVIVLYGFWELTTITSFLLIGNSHGDGRARAAALQALLVTSLGALAMLVGTDPFHDVLLISSYAAWVVVGRGLTSLGSAPATPTATEVHGIRRRVRTSAP